MEFLEKKYTADASEDECIRLAIETLLEVVDAGLKNIEIGILRKGQPMEVSCVLAGGSYSIPHWSHAVGFVGFLDVG